MTSSTSNRCQVPFWSFLMPSSGKTQWVTRFTQQVSKISLLVGLSVLLDITAGIASAHAELDLRVAVEEDVDQVRVGSSTKALLRDGSGQVLAEIPAGYVVVQEQAGQVNVDRWQGPQFWIEPTENGYTFIDGKWYRGKAQVVSTAGGLTAVNHVDLEHYLYSVVGSEMPASWPLEALKAQAVSARTYALYQREHNANTVFDVGDTTAWQVYDGLEEEAVSTHAAVDATTGQVLTHNGRIIEAVFHSSSGGHTENVEDIWSGSRPYLRGVVDFDQSAPVYRWDETFSAASLRQRISGVGTIISMTPEQTTPRGRIIRMRVVGDEGSRVLSGNELRRALNLKSSLFSIVPQMGRVASAGDAIPARPISFQVSGRGFGHGVGMSQWGANQMAQHGNNYQQILGHYYQNTTLSRIQVE
ncbi:MAG: SpoIID/LytB domain-containing protein [Elainellaceae cyanobacterium]